MKTKDERKEIQDGRDVQTCKYTPSLKILMPYHEDPDVTSLTSPHALNAL